MCTFSQRLYDLRRERNLTQEQLSKLTEVPVRSIIRYEKGETTPSSSTARNNGNTNLTVLANFFGVYPEWLLTGKGFKNEWEELQESAKTSTTHKWVVEARLKKRNELRTSILKYYKLENPVIESENMTHKQWEQAEKESHAINDLINSIFNYMDYAVETYQKRISEI